ncbi:MAG: glycosyltransferase family 8 protein [Selenomonadaceae bacterium]|nr:glycosyltransferase family 8 protein [Selenomonadaceae bacterium]MBQ9496457.1 glycosyltransferase family 8 protein [Selenomonadaceae bacterium]
MIHVCFGLYDKTGGYSKFTGTAMASIFENTITPPQLPSITIHILHDNTLTLDNREKFSYLAGQYNQRVKFYNVEELCADRIEKIKRAFPNSVASRFTIGTFYRLFIPQLLSEDIKKIIYLDSDIVVNLDLNELWRIELGDRPLAGVPEMTMGSSWQRMNVGVWLCRAGFVKHEDYLNSGVLIMNLNVLRAEEEKFLSAFDFAREHQQKTFSDQDILNYCFVERALKLPPKFNQTSGYTRKSGKTKLEDRIYHYAGGSEGDGVGLDADDFLNRLWMKYFVKTPWFGGEAIGKLYSAVRQMNIDLKNFMIQISAAVSGKTRAFFTAPANVNALKKIFRIRDDEEIFLAENQSSLQKLIDAMNASRGKKVFFILLQYFPFQILTEAGFESGKDFFDGMKFLSAANGLPLNSYPLLHAM